MGFQLGANREWTYEAPIKSLWPKSTLSLCTETQYTDIQIIPKQTRVFHGSSPPLPMVMWFFIQVLYLISLQNKCPKTCLNPGNGLSPENPASFFCEARQSSAIQGEREAWWARAPVTGSGSDAPRHLAQLQSLQRLLPCAAQPPSVVHEGMGHTSGSCSFSYPLPQCICWGSVLLWNFLITYRYIATCLCQRGPSQRQCLALTAERLVSILSCCGISQSGTSPAGRW